jgi:hypothetical protein
MDMGQAPQRITSQFNLSLVSLELHLVLSISQQMVQLTQQQLSGLIISHRVIQLQKLLFKLEDKYPPLQKISFRKRFFYQCQPLRRKIIAEAVRYVLNCVRQAR